jgi:hypothetical protein
MYGFQAFYNHFLSRDVMLWAQFKLVGMVVLVVAFKDDEKWFPSIIEFNKISESYFTCLFHNVNYSQEKINSIESKILNKLGWKLMVPVSTVFIDCMESDLSSWESNLSKTLPSAGF